MTEQTPPDLPAAVQPEWIAVPKPADAPTPPPRNKKMGFIAMGLGLIALLSSIVSALYLLPLAILAAILGVAAVVLGVISLFTRVRPLGPVITGVVTGALALFSAIIIGVFALGTLAVGNMTFTESRQEQPTENGRGDQKNPDTDNATAAPAELEWPANMATGGILFGAGLQPVPSEPLNELEVPATSPTNRENGVADIRVYVDYRCPHCATFEDANGDTLEDLVESGAATLELVPLTFLDRASEGTYYSSRAAAAVACVVNSQPEKTWDAHTALLDSDVQPQGPGPGLTDAQLLAVIDDAVDGANPEVSACITDQRFVTFASALSTWSFGVPIPNTIEPDLAVTSTPTVVVNGVVYAGDPANEDAFKQFLTQTLGTPSN